MILFTLFLRKKNFNSKKIISFCSLRKGLFLIFLSFFLIILSLPLFAALEKNYNVIATIPGCGDEVVKKNEHCDGPDLGGQTCISLGGTGGTLNCNANCTFNIFGCTTASSGGGGSGNNIDRGSGGDYYSPPVTVIVFSGRAYPKSTVTLLKDGQIATTAIADFNANFQISISNFFGGNYIFSLYSEDKDNQRSNVLTYPTGVVTGATTSISNIFISPTIAVDKSEVKQGSDIIVSGQSAPQADIIILITYDKGKEFFVKVISNKDGTYSYNFNTLLFKQGNYSVKTKALINNQLESDWSYPIDFKIGIKNIFVKQAVIIGDFNKDGRVNLVDFSIIAYWYKRPFLPTDIDLSSNGQIDIVDFSIIAYYWTG